MHFNYMKTASHGAYYRREREKNDKMKRGEGREPQQKKGLK